MRGERNESALNPYLSRIPEFLWVIVNNNFKQHSIFLMAVKSCEQNLEEMFCAVLNVGAWGSCLLGVGMSICGEQRGQVPTDVIMACHIKRPLGSPES